MMLDFRFPTPDPQGSRRRGMSVRRRRTSPDRGRATARWGAVPILLVMLLVLTPPQGPTSASVHCEVTPENAENPVGTSHSLTVKVNSNGYKLADTRMVLRVAEGPNAGVEVTGTTDGSGKVVLTYTSNGNPGTDRIEISGIDPDLNTEFDCGCVTKTWLGGQAVTKPAEEPAEQVRLPGAPGVKQEEGPKEDVTAETADPIFAGGGEYRQAWTLLSGGAVIPIDFRLLYAPDLRSRTPTTDGRMQFPPWDGIGGFTSNAVIRIVEFEDDSEDAYINVLLGNELVILAENAGGEFEGVGPEEYRVRRVGDHYYLMDPIRELVYIFRSRAFEYAWVEDGKVIQFVRRVGEVVYVFDRNDNRLAYTYNEDRLPTSISDGLGRSLQFSYATSPDAEGRHLERVTDSSGRMVRFAYRTVEGHEVVSSFTDAMGQTTSFEYDRVTDEGLHLLKAVILPSGESRFTQTWGIRPGDAFAVVRQRDALGNETQLSWTWESQADPVKSLFGLGPSDAAGGVDLVGNLITTVTHPDETQRSLLSERGRYLLELTDEAGNQIALEYNSDWQMTSIATRTDGELSIAYDTESGKPESIINARGEILRFTYVSQDQVFANPESGDSVSFTFRNLTRVDYPDGSQEMFAYDDRGNVIERVDSNGASRTYEYGERGQVTEITNSAGGTVTHTYNEDGTAATTTTSGSGTIRFSYDEMRRAVAVEMASDGEAGSDAASGGTVHVEYDRLDRVVSITDANGTTAYGYNEDGNLVSITDPFGCAMLHDYDTMGRLSRLTNRRGMMTTYLYDEMGRLASIVDANGNAMTFGYDARGWLNAVDVAGDTWQLGLDDEGSVTTETSPLGNVTSYGYDELGYVTSIADPLGHTTSFTRDAMSRVIEISDPLSRAVGYAYDTQGLLVGATVAGIGTATYDRDALGSLDRVTDLKDGVWRFEHTDTGMLREIVDPLGSMWLLSYDDRAQLRERAYPDGETQTIVRDEVGNVIQRRFSSGETLAFEYDSLNRLTAADGLRLTLNEEGEVSSTESHGTAYGATYDDAGRLVAVEYGDGLFTVTYEYDERDLLTKVTDSLSAGEIRLRYDADGRLISMERANGIDSSFEWDAASRLLRIEEGGLAELGYEYNDADEVVQETRTDPSGTRIAQYAYDSAGRLVSVDYDANHRLGFEYDAAGNLLARNGTTPFGDVPTWASRRLAYDASCRIDAASYTYDDRGRLTSSPTGRFDWSGSSRLVGINDTVLTYNGLGDLTSRTQGDASLRYYYNYALGLTPIVSEADPARDAFTRHYVWAPDGSLLYSIDVSKGGAVQYYHFDVSGCTRILTDEVGRITDTYEYSPYGILLSHEGDSDQPFTFGGELGVRQEDTDQDLYQMRDRYYDAASARFLSRETIWPLLDDPMGLNPYQFVHLNPVGFADPLGLWPKIRVKPRVKVRAPLRQGAKRVDVSDGDNRDASFWERAGYGILESIPGWEALHDMYVNPEPAPQGPAAHFGGQFARDVYGAPFLLMETTIETLRDLAWWHVGGEEAPDKNASWWERALWKTSKWMTESDIIIPLALGALQKIQEGWEKIGEWTVVKGGEIGREWGSDVGTFIYGSQKEKVELTHSIYSSKNPLTVAGRETGAALYTVGETASSGYSSYYKYVKFKVLDLLY